MLDVKLGSKTKIVIAGAMKVNAWICAPATDRDLESGLSKSANVKTRMVSREFYDK